MTELVSFHRHLKDLLAGHLNAAVASLGLLLGQFLAEDLELLNKVSLVLGNREALGLLWELTRGHQSLLGLFLQLVLTTGRHTKRERGRKEQNGKEMREKKAKRKTERGDKMKGKNGVPIQNVNMLTCVK